jgi:hypothetical protein
MVLEICIFHFIVQDMDRPINVFMSIWKAAYFPDPSAVNGMPTINVACLWEWFSLISMIYDKI